MSKKKTEKGAKSQFADAMPNPGVQQVTAHDPYPYKKRLKLKKYEKTLLSLQIELLKVQNWAKENDERIVVVFEGRDAAGKGGTIKRFLEHLNPRGAHAVASPNVTLNSACDRAVSSGSPMT